MNLGGYNYTNFQNVRVKGNNSGGPGSVRLKATSSFEQTLLANEDYTDADKTITLPAKTGTLGVSGTFTVNLPAVGANDIYGTNVAVSGLRAEDGVVCSIQGMTTTGIGTRGYVFIGGVDAGNGYANLTFVNTSNTSTLVRNDVVVAYTAVR